jgi:hypothetical protein
MSYPWAWRISISENSMAHKLEVAAFFHNPEQHAATLRAAPLLSRKISPFGLINLDLISEKALF